MTLFLDDALRLVKDDSKHDKPIAVLGERDRTLVHDSCSYYVYTTFRYCTGGCPQYRTGGTIYK